MTSRHVDEAYFQQLTVQFQWNPEFSFMVDTCKPGLESPIYNIVHNTRPTDVSRIKFDTPVEISFAQSTIRVYVTRDCLPFLRCNRAVILGKQNLLCGISAWHDSCSQNVHVFGSIRFS